MEPSEKTADLLFRLPNGGENVRLVSEMTAALGQKDRYTRRHAGRVAAYAGRLARRLGYPQEEVDQIALGGVLHDVGKLALSDRLFSRQQDELNEELKRQVYSHPLIGVAILSDNFGMGAVLDAVLFHHERLDGSGYPFGLHDDQIPMIAQIISVVDCFDAITSDRPYQQKQSPAQAFRILEQMAGNCLDRELVSLLIEDVRETGMAESTAGGQN